MLAMVAQTPRAFRQPTSSLTTIASMLAPTGFWCHAHICIPTPHHCRSEHARDGGPDTAGIQTAHVIVNDHRDGSTCSLLQGAAAFQPYKTEKL